MYTLVVHIVALHRLGGAHDVFHPGVAENIAPAGGPGSDVIVEGIPLWDNSWVQDVSFYTVT